MDIKEWGQLWNSVVEVQQGFEPGIVYIRGVAVYAHTLESENSKGFIQFSHDADFMISVSDYTDLKDIEEVIPNRRLRKSQFYKNNFEFDVYVDGQNDLPVPYTEISAHSEIKSGIRVASLEHLIVLKLKAFENRKGSGKGEKDENDLFKLLLLVSEREVIADAVHRIDDQSENMLKEIITSDASLRICDANAHQASALRKAAIDGLKKISWARNQPLGLDWK